MGAIETACDAEAAEEEEAVVVEAGAQVREVRVVVRVERLRALVVRLQYSDEKKRKSKS